MLQDAKRGHHERLVQCPANAKMVISKGKEASQTAPSIQLRATRTLDHIWLLWLWGGVSETCPSFRVMLVLHIGASGSRLTKLSTNPTAPPVGYTAKTTPQGLY